MALTGDFGTPASSRSAGSPRTSARPNFAVSGDRGVTGLFAVWALTGVFTVWAVGAMFAVFAVGAVLASAW